MAFKYVAEILNCLNSGIQLQSLYHFDAKVSDSATVVHSLPIGQGSTFGEYSTVVFKVFVRWTLYGTHTKQIT